MLWCIIQARMGSSRLPGKALIEIKGKPIIKRVYEQCKSIIPNTIVAIPSALEENGDDKLYEYLYNEHIPVYLGSHIDVLKRYYSCARTYGASQVVRVTGDCPFIDQHKLYHHVNIASQMGVDFATNAQENRTSRDGNDIEYMSFRCLEWLNGRALKEEHREHVTKYFYDNQQEFSQTGMKSLQFVDPINYSKLIKTSIDTQEDIDRLEGFVV